MSGRVGFRRELLRGALMLAALASADSASAGGFEIPDNGTQAVGRGGAFVAKADDPTAIYYNPAGLARQRGTNFLFNANILLHSFEFQRLKQFPDDPQDAETPWGNAPFPVVKNIAGPFVAPFVALTTDFGYFDRVTFGAGLFGPSTVGNRTFPLGVENKPAASRYDYVQSRSSILFPTASAAVRVTPWLDLGLSAHLVLASFDQTTVSYADLGKDICKNPEYFRCDSLNTLIATGTSFGATIGAMARPSVATAFGLSLRTPINITAVGQVTPEAPRAFDKELTAGAATLQLQLPWMIKAGGRYIGMDADFELYDLELDVTYEAWGVAQKFGPIVDIPTLGAFKDIQTVVLHGYNNTVGIRGGGAYNIDTGEGSLLSLRAGAYFDSPATDYPYTRLDFDTLAKVAGTFGIGYKVGSFDFNLAYAAVASVPRLVGEGVGEIRPVNGVKNGSTVGADDQPLPAVNEGSYRGFTHIISVGVSVSIDSFFGPPRQIHYGNDYEPNYVGEEGTAPEKKKIEEKKKLDEEKIREEKPSTDDEKKREVEKPEKKPPPDDEKKREVEKPEKKPPPDDEKKPEKKPPPDDEKKPEKKPPPDDEKKPEKKPDKKITPPPDDLPEKPEKPPEKPPEVKKPPPPPPPPPPPEKPPSKRREWWEEID